MTMDPASELANLKFTPRTSAWKHMQRFERLCSQVYPRSTDAGKWSLFVKTIQDTNNNNAWASTKGGLTPGRWLMDLNEEWIRNNPPCEDPNCDDCKNDTMSFDYLKNAFLERWGRPEHGGRDQSQHPPSSHSYSHNSMPTRDSESGSETDREPSHALVPHSSRAARFPPAAPTPPNEPVSENERLVQETKTSISINSANGAGQIVLQISDNKQRGGNKRKKHNSVPPQSTLEGPPSRSQSPQVHEGPPAPDPQVVQVIDAAPESHMPLMKPLTPPTPHRHNSDHELATLPPTPRSPPPPPLRPRLLEGKICAITGASRGIGRAIALGFAREGAHIIAHYWGTKADPANEEIVSLCVEIRSLQQGCTIVFGDISDPRTSENIIRRAVETYGHLDIAVSNAGMCWYRDFLDVTPELLRRHVDVNLNGSFYFVQAAARQFKRQFHLADEQGLAGKDDYAVLCISSGTTGEKQAHFSPTAAGIKALMDSCAIGLAKYGVRCNTLSPGVTQTKMVREEMMDMEKRGRMEKRVPLGRLGTPQDCVGPAIWLVGEGGRYVTGAEIRVDGGAAVNV